MRPRLRPYEWIVVYATCPVDNPLHLLFPHIDTSILETSGPIAQSPTSRTRNTWADSRRELAFRKLLRDPSARTSSEHRRVYSERGIRVTRALQILSETLFSLPSLTSSPFCIASGATPSMSRTSPVYSFDESEKRPAIRHRGTVRSASLLARHQRGAFHERGAWLKYHPATRALVSLGKVNTIPLVPYVLFSLFSAE